MVIELCMRVSLRTSHFSCLQQPPLVSRPKPDQLAFDPSTESDDLEQLPHLRRTQQFLRLCSERQIRCRVVRGGGCKQIRDAGIDQKMRLRRVALQLEPCVDAGVRDRSEVDVAGYVLQSRQEEGVVVRAVTIVAHERAAVALWMVILAAAEAVV